jgi:peptide/nickel transport system substrate-binding protein
MFRDVMTSSGDTFEAATERGRAASAPVWRFAILLLLLPSLVLVGCGGKKSANGSGGQLVIDQQWDLMTSDPARDSSLTGRYVTNAVYDTLTKIKPKLVDGKYVFDLNKPDPWLAESYSVDDTGKVWTFNIRKDVVFSDDTPLTADDVVFSLLRLQNVKSGGAAPTITESWVSVKAVDDHTVQITTKAPNPAIPQLLTHNGTGIVNSKVAKAHGATDAADAAKTDHAQTYFDKNSLGSGPYMYKSFSTTGETVLVRNPHFWGDKPYYDTLVFRNVTTEVARQNVKSGRSDVVVALTDEQASGMPASVTVHRGPSLTFFYIQANYNKNVSSLAANPNLWEAMRYGMDYDKLVRLAGKGATQMCGLVPRGSLGALDQSECVHRDVPRAKAALARAMAQSGVKDATLTVEFPTDFGLEGLSFGTMAEAVQQDLAEIGLKLKLRGAPLTTWLPRWIAAKPEIVQAGQSSIFPHENAISGFLPTGYRGQYAGYKATDAPDLTALGVRAMQTLDDAKRAVLFKQLQEKFNTEVPIFPQFQASTIIAASSRVKGIVIIPGLIFDPTLLYEEK